VSLIHNERTKLLATALNNAAVGCFTAGVIGLVIALTLEVPGSRDRPGMIVLMIVIWILTALNLHLVAQLVLGRLKE
jgi:hypothetical protein